MNHSIHQLRKQGYKIRVIHFRLPGPQPIQKLRESKTPPESKGGITRIELTTPDGKDYQAEAKCSKQDSFNRRIGNQICLGRIFKQIENSRV